jgi:hypothetical protein
MNTEDKKTEARQNLASPITPGVGTSLTPGDERMYMSRLLASEYSDEAIAARVKRLQAPSEEK